MEPISFDELVARREQRRADKLAVTELRIPGTDKTLLARKPSEDVLLDLYGRLSEAQTAAECITVADEGLYHCCEALQDGALREAIGVSDPLDVVPALFDLPTRNQMGGQLFRFLGLTGTEEEDPVKN